ncbi:MAG: PcfJ domain-containing protein [Myxococcota bacterium]
MAARIVMGEWRGHYPGPAAFAVNCQRLAKAFPRAKHSEKRRELVRLLTVVELNSALLETPLTGRNRVVETLLWLARESRSWVREPESWSGASTRAMRSLFRHLFERYPVPEFFDQALPPNDPRFGFEWYRHVAAGHNIRTAPGLPVSLTKREAHLMMQAPKHLTPSAALRWGRFRAVGASPSLTAIFLRRPVDFVPEDVWLSLAEKLAAAGGVPHSQVSPLCDYVGFRLREESFSLKGRSVSSLRRGMEEWHRTLRQQPRRSYRWDPSSRVSPFQEEQRGFLTRIDELCSSEELAREGAEMRHCVRSYDFQCLKGNASIFALRSSDPSIRRVTIRLDGGGGRVVEARGFANAYPTRVEQRVIERWAAENRLQVDWRQTI